MLSNNKNNDLVSWLTLLHIPKLGPVTALKILESFVSPAELLATSREELLDCGLSKELINYLKQPNQQAIDQCLQWAQGDNNHVITWQDAAYPCLLKQTAGAPLVLFVCGNPEILSTTQLAMVGSRSPTPTGIDIAYQFAQHLGSNGFTITSGLALGIDAACHQGVLAGKGKTIAVMGTGADQVYPQRHKTLAKQILEEGGALVTEFPPGTLPKAENFPRRNRIISGLSLGTLVVEAAVQSGSLITARYALEQGREVFAVPGSIHNPLARGCHALLKQGAKLVETAGDILEEFASTITPAPLMGERLKKIPLSRFAGEGGRLIRPSATFSTSGEENMSRCHLRPGEGENKYPSSGAAHHLLPEGEKGIKLDSEDAKLVECIGFETTNIDTLIERSGLGANVVSARLMMLELQGYVTAVPGGYVKNSSKLG